MDDTYAYDAAGSRMTRTESGETVAYTLGTGDRLASWTGGAYAYDDSWQVIVDLDEQGSVVVSCVWGYVDSQNDVVARWRYDAWGNVIAEDVSVPALARLRYRFQGREWSAATGLTNFRMRWYDSETGRWLSKDPIGLSGGLNLYAFCGNCPNNFVDPHGTIAPAVIGGLIGGIVGALVGGIGSMFNGGGFWSGAIPGAIGGAITGSTFGLLSPAVTGVGTGLAVGAGTGALGGVALGVAGEIMKPGCEDFDWGNVGASAVGGAIGGGITGGHVGIGGSALREAANFGSETLISGDVSLWSTIVSTELKK